ncbi:MAG: hypothetical protein KJP05_08075 [Deltaproteobacteria bacterium]|nr:hypothetical protein [Deltaproteobacteria bacterium]
MDLLQKIKSDRAQSKKKRPFKRTLFDKVSGLVRTYSLEVSFLSRLEIPEDYLSEAKVEFVTLRKKRLMEFPLFSLVAEKEYRLTTAIMSKVNNPYLEFAQSPDEIAISKTLFDLNPYLGAETLARCHFETLLLCERAKKEMKNLVKQARNSQRKKGAGSEKEFVGDGGSLPDSLEKRIEQLQSFVARVDDIVKSH